MASRHRAGDQRPPPRDASGRPRREPRAKTILRAGACRSPRSPGPQRRRGAHPGRGRARPLAGIALAAIPRVAIALGSNIGDRVSHLQYSIERLRQHLRDVQVSSFIETEPVGVGPQAPFLNAALVGVSDLGARDLLSLLSGIERERGRTRPFPGAPRTLDLDLIMVGDAVIDEPDLAIPHPRFRERRFVLEPLAEIAPTLIDPVTELSVGQLLDRLEIRGEVRLKPDATAEGEVRLKPDATG
ncbi:MAG: 2-amino-4-hydroxy-6-hydroxymethyldihydropteridine diphosphokinase, partial [Acidobacteria bacterium]|nr:2-amino-4-hydroxy-6-hydroxymethyldihydropteridine diphosphokinase [Acidobacteriota bacterium]